MWPNAPQLPGGPGGARTHDPRIKDGTGVCEGVSQVPNFRVFTGILSDLSQATMTTT